MPVKNCSINGNEGYKWGDNGKCYTGPDAKEKAIAQGVAIEKFLSIKEKLSPVRISFDFDGVLTTSKYQSLLKQLLSAGGNTIYIISARNNSAELYSFGNKFGIPISRIYAVGSNNKKVEKIKELGIKKHYDNNQDVISELPGIGVLVK